MRTGQKRVFTLEKIMEMVALKKSGWSYPKLAKRYDCDHSSVVYQYQKYEKFGLVYLKNVINGHKSKEGLIKPPGYKPPTPREDLCLICEMRLDSNYHIANPCRS